MTDPNKSVPDPEKQARFVSNLLFETPGGIRFTQDSPILPMVWMAYAETPRSQQELILTVDKHASTGRAAWELRNMLKNFRKKLGETDKAKSFDAGPAKLKPHFNRNPPRISFIPGQLAVKLYFDELIRVVLPLTPWWQNHRKNLRNNTEFFEKAAKKFFREDEKVLTALLSQIPDWNSFPICDDHMQRDITTALMLMRREIHPGPKELSHDRVFWDNLSEFVPSGMLGLPEIEVEYRRYVKGIPADLIWLVRICGIINECFRTGNNLLVEDTLSFDLELDFNARMLKGSGELMTLHQREVGIAEIALEFQAAIRHRANIVNEFNSLFEGWCSDPEEIPEDKNIWRITRNRPINLAVETSSLTVKADAARRLFDISCADITWAIIDSGIDGKHPAFLDTSAEIEDDLWKDKRAADGRANKLPLRKVTKSRVVKTLDFTKLRSLLDVDIWDADQTDEQRAKKKLLRVRLALSLSDDVISDNLTDDQANDILTEAARRGYYPDDIIDNLYKRISEGHDINWRDLEHFIVVKNPLVPTNDHGTHVAGILGADWIEDYDNEEGFPLKDRTRRMRGVCPDIKLIDVRVFNEHGLTDEFELIAAIQYLRWMNERAGGLAVHGANLSLSLIHEVRRFACGQTPICNECDESVSLGMVMVAAAGNRGFEMSDMNEVMASDSFKSVSITDPGNAEKVITVGSTHRKRPHEYGVSYFSSRGPTGDGRLKPDLIAPGEKISGPIPGEREESKDGTSMAAPHVSGAAAMMMARHSELIGRPERIKEILCGTATDLGRERYFQGSGLLDILRALQSV